MAGKKVVRTYIAGTELQVPKLKSQHLHQQAQSHPCSTRKVTQQKVQYNIVYSTEVAEEVAGGML
jgi:hypothetical protein